MTMLVTILQILAWILFVVLVLVIGLVAVVLFVPIRYRSHGKKTHAECELYGQATFCNPLLRAKVTYESELLVTVRVFGIKVYVFPKQEEQDEVVSMPIGDEREEVVSHNAEAFGDMPDIIQEDVNTPTPKREDADTPKQKQGVGVDPKPTKEKETNRIQGVLDKIRNMYSIFQEEKETIRSFLTDCMVTLKRILPYVCKVNISYGTGEADETGYIYAFYCMMQPFLSKDIYLEPVWLEKILEGEYTLKGRIRVIHLVILTYKIITKKEYHALYSKIKGGLTYGRSSSE